VAETTKTIVISSERGEVVTRVDMTGAVLHGHCEWYDGESNLVAYGFFKSGVPFTGTFLNWAKFFDEFSKDNPYDPAAYCKDWVTIFEAGFDSEPPKYEMVIEAYWRGERL
jgi:hypothetical protein